MNERIKDYYDQVGLDFENFQRVTVTKGDMERFAELIVRGCIKESMEEIVSDEDIAQQQEPLIREYLKGNNQGIVDAVVRFRNHFGVEE